MSTIKTCPISHQQFEVTDREITFLSSMTPTFAGKSFPLPEPRYAPSIRRQKRLAMRSESHLFKTQDGITGEPLISCFSPESPFPVISNARWWSDTTDNRLHGREYDPSRSFFEQMRDLSTVVPRMARNVLESTLENSEYTDNAGNLKDCYLVSGADQSRDCYYSRKIEYCTWVVDCTYVNKLEESYECVSCENSRGLYYSLQCDSCTDAWFLVDCRWCRDCFGCTGLENQQYCLWNQQLTKEEYLEKKGELLHPEHFAATLKKAHEFLTSQKVEGLGRNLRSEEVTGRNISDSRRIMNGADITASEDLIHCTRMYDAQSSMDSDIWGVGVKRTYECVAIGYNISDSSFCYQCYTDVSRLYYCITCVTLSTDCFGCIGLKGARYCILNKQYPSKEEYEAKVSEIITDMVARGEWGEFLPGYLAPSAYNFSLAQEYMPLSKSEAIENGFWWSDYEKPIPQVAKIIPANRLPASIIDIPDDVLSWAIECSETLRPFRIEKRELEFYRKHSLPLPHKHPDVRWRARDERRKGVFIAW